MLKPSSVSLLQSFPPLTGTMGRAELEAAATLMVRACQLEGDVFVPLLPRAIGEMLRDDVDGGVEPLASLSRNPFWRPDFHGLVNKGFARWTTDDEHAPIEFTAKGLEALTRHAVPVDALPKEEG